MPSTGTMAGLRSGPCDPHNPQQGQVHLYPKLSDEQTECSPVEKDLGRPVDEKLGMTWHESPLHTGLHQKKSSQ